jgi:hypothetical protein
MLDCRVKPDNDISVETANKQFHFPLTVIYDDYIIKAIARW